MKYPSTQSGRFLNYADFDSIENDVQEYMRLVRGAVVEADRDCRLFLSVQPRRSSTQWRASRVPISGRAAYEDTRRLRSASASAAVVPEVKSILAEIENLVLRIVLYAGYRCCAAALHGNVKPPHGGHFRGLFLSQLRSYDGVLGIHRLFFDDCRR